MCGGLVKIRCGGLVRMCGGLARRCGSLVRRCGGLMVSVPASRPPVLGSKLRISARGRGHPTVWSEGRQITL